MGRSARWADRRYYDVAFTEDREQDDPERSEVKRKTFATVDESINREKVIPLDFIGCARELILEVTDDGELNLRFIAFTLNTTLGCLELGEIILGRDLDDNTVKQKLALALFHEVPVYPEDARAAGELQRIYQSLLVDGLSGSGTDGDDKKYVLVDPDTYTAVSKLDSQNTRLPSASVQPADLLLQVAGQKEREREFAEAARVLAKLRSAITQLDECLSDTERDEAKIQTCLTANPILFGLEYLRVVAKHRLGSEYEMDYALQHVAGFYDLVEIEASSHRLFSRSGNPMAALTHAEQQVLDWLQWIEENYEYARKRLPGLVRPRGYVVIGRDHTLSAQDKVRLDRRNATWGDSLAVLTFDNLLQQARNMLSLLEAAQL